MVKLLKSSSKTIKQCNNKTISNAGFEIDCGSDIIESDQIINNLWLIFPKK